MRSAEPRTVRLVGETLGRSCHGIQVALAPDSAFGASGNLRVTGQGELQALLATSPIRLMSTFLKGGDADWMLGR